MPTLLARFSMTQHHEEKLGQQESRGFTADWVYLITRVVLDDIH